MKYSPYIKVLRPSQWLKNLIIYFPPFLGGEFLKPGIFLKGIIPFLSFCLVASAIYIFNDILDRTTDLYHPQKKHRPIASGAISLPVAYIMCAVLLACSFFLGSQVSVPFLFITLAYLLISIAYSLRLKALPIVDLFCISAGFVLRLLAGGEAFQLVISEWLFLSVFLLSIFLSTGKRLCEKITLGDSAVNHRESLLAYPAGFLDGAMYLTGSTVLVTYIMYSLTRPALVYTVPLCTFGLLRYILRVKLGLGGDPTESLLKDMPLFLVGILWVFIVGLSIYGT